MLDNWREHNECSPWSEGDNYYIVVESDHQSLGNDTERGYRLVDAKLKGVGKLLQFYGKEVPEFLSLNAITFASQVEDYFVGYKPFLPMKVLVSVPRFLFEQIPDDTSSCDIIRPEEGYIETSISVYNFAEQINFVVNTIESYIPALSRSSRFISNINILAELKRLRQAGSVIERYLIRNKIISDRPQFDSCDPEIDKRLKIGYNFAYEGIYALVDNEQHTIGYHCFVNNETINHLTTANYLIHLDSMHEMLTSRDSNTFDIFAFLSRFTLPVPIIRDKENQTDGLSLYADKGVSFGFADLAKIISLDIDINLCKSDEEVADEERRFLDPETRRNLLESAKSIKKFAGDMSLSSENVEGLKDRVAAMRGIEGVPYPIIKKASDRARTKAIRKVATADPGSTSTSSGMVDFESQIVSNDLWVDDEYTLYTEIVDSEVTDINGIALAKRVVIDPATGNMTEGEETAVLPNYNIDVYRKATQPPAGKEALKTLYKDVLSKIDVACMVNDALQCYVDRTIALVGEQVLDGDEELGEVINASISLGKMVNARCEFEKCNGSPDIDVSIGFPIFQGIQIPDNFPTFDFLAGMIDAALDQLYAALVNMLVSAILRILQNSCEVLFDDALGEGDAVASVKEGFQDWLGESIGIDYEDLNNSQAWGDALTTTGGTGFIGAVGNLLGRGIASGYATVEDTGVALNLPNPEKGWQVEEYLVSTASVYKFLGDLRTASDSINAVTSEQEQVLLYQGTASEQTQSVVYNCLKIQNPAFSALFKNKYELADLLSAMGKLVKPEFLEHIPDTSKSPPPDFCHLGDGSDARMIREALLSEKDPELTEGEMNNIINKEITHNTKKIQELQSTLQNIMDGSLAPSFPSLFGQSTSLVPELPSALKDVAMIAIDGPLGAIVTSFSIDTMNYANIWKEYYIESGEYDSDAAAISPSDIFYKMTSNNRTLHSLKDNVWRKSTDIHDYKNQFTLGYSLSDVQEAGLNFSLVEKSEELIGGPYSFGKKLEFTGLNLILSRRGSGRRGWGSWGVDPSDQTFYALSNPNKNEDDAVIMQMLNDLNIAGGNYGVTPYALKKHPKANRVEGKPWNVDTSEEAYLWLHENAPNWMWLRNWLFDVRFEENRHRKDTMTDHYLEYKKMSLSQPAPGAEVASQTDEVYNAERNFWNGIPPDDPGDEIHVEWEKNEDTKDITVYLSRIYFAPLDAGATAVATRAQDHTRQLVTYEHKRRGNVVYYDEEHYEIGSFPHYLGRKIATGELAPRRFATVGDGQLSPSVFSTARGNDPLPATNNLTFDPSNFSPNLGPMQAQAAQESENLRQQVVDLIAPPVTSDPSGVRGQALINNMTDDMFFQFARYICDGKYTEGHGLDNELVANSQPHNTESNLDPIDLVYSPSKRSTDILGFGDLKDFSSHMSTLALTLSTKAASKQHPDVDKSQVGDPATSGDEEDYCDIISPTRRVSTIANLVMLIRLFIVERALISIQVFNGFELGFMNSEIFVTSILNSMRDELKQYTRDFQLNMSSDDPSRTYNSTVSEADLWGDCGEAALKYYEMLRLDGDPEIPSYTDSDARHAIKQMIRDEIPKIPSRLKAALKLHGQKTPVLADGTGGDPYGSWDQYLTEKVFGEFETGVGPTGAEWPTKDDFVDVYKTHGNIMNLLSRYISKLPGGDYFNPGSRPNTGTDWVYDATGNSDMLWHLPLFAFEKHVISPLSSGTDDKTRFSYRLVLITPTIEIREEANTPQARSSQDLDTILAIEEAEIMEEVDYFILDRKTILSTECEVDGGYTGEQWTQLFTNLRQEMWELPEYKEIFYSLFPVQDMVASLSLLEYAALSDTAVFPEAYYGVNLHDMLARTKLSAIQSFTSAKYGYRNINYEDPYETKAGSDFAPLSNVDLTTET